MARVKGADAIKRALKKYGGSEFKYFTLPNDNDSAQVRLLHMDESDLEIRVVHKVSIDEREKWVECLQEDGCPFCEKYGKPQIKIFISLFKVGDPDTIYVWERGSTVIEDLLGLLQKYGHLNNRNYEIVRHGKKGDSKTKYQFLPEDKEEMDLPSRPDIIGKLVLEWSEDQMVDYIKENTVIERARGRQQNSNGF